MYDNVFIVERDEERKREREKSRSTPAGSLTNKAPTGVNRHHRLATYGETSEGEGGNQKEKNCQTRLAPGIEPGTFLGVFSCQI